MKRFSIGKKKDFSKRGNVVRKIELARLTVLNYTNIVHKKCKSSTYNIFLDNMKKAK